MKRVFIVHGWGDKPDDHWIPYLKNQLEGSGFEVEALAMPNPDEPKIEPWVAKLNEAVGKVDQDTLYVGHSVGCQTVMRHLEQQPDGTVCGGALFVAPWFTLVNLSGPAEEAIAKPWIETAIDLDKVKTRLPRLIALFSDDDPWVTLDNKGQFEHKLGAKTEVLHDKKHLGVDANLTSFPKAYSCVMELVKDVLPKRYTVKLKSGERLDVGEFDSLEAVTHWVNTGKAGVEYKSEHLSIFPSQIEGIEVE